MKNTNRSPFIYPVYIVQVLNQLMEDSVKNRNGILSKRADIVEILYNQSNNFPITEQVYQMMWVWIIKMLNAGHYDWIKQYWNIANQYCTFKLEYSNKKDEKNKFLEFHIMVGVLLFYKKSYNLLQHIFNFTNTLPAKYPLIPSTFSQIFYIYEELSEKNKRMYLLNYHMSMVFEGAGEENKIEGLLVNYLALLMIRLYDVNDYNITYSNPLDTPATGNTIEENDNKIELANILIERIKRITDDQLKECGLSTMKNQRVVVDLLKQYIAQCSQKNNDLKQNSDISKDKQELIKASLIDSVKEYKPQLPQSSKQEVEENDKEFTASQSVKLDEYLILNSHSAISSNLGEALINALNSQVQQFYCYQFSLNSALKNYTIPYRDFSRAMKRLSISPKYVLLAMGIPTHFFDEVEGFIRENNAIHYNKSDVYEIPSNNETSILIMKKEDIPCYKFRKLTDTSLTEIESTRYLFSNVDSLTKEEPILTVKQGFSIHMPQKLRYIRLQVAYHLESDEMLIQKVEPITNNII